MHAKNLSPFGRSRTGWTRRDFQLLAAPFLSGPRLISSDSGHHSGGVPPAPNARDDDARGCECQAGRNDRRAFSIDYIGYGPCSTAWARRCAATSGSICSFGNRLFCAASSAMERCIIFYLQCHCGSRGSIVELDEVLSPPQSDSRSHFTLRALSSDGGYAGRNPLFALLRPACGRCGRALAPGSVVAVSELGEVAVISPGACHRYWIGP